MGGQLAHLRQQVRRCAGAEATERQASHCLTIHRRRLETLLGATQNINCSKLRSSMNSSPPLLSPRRASLWPHNSSERLLGKHVVLAPLQEKHAQSLFSQIGGVANAELWEDMSNGPSHDLDAFSSYLKTCATSQEKCYWVVQDRQTGDIFAHLSYFFASPLDDAVEIGQIVCARNFHGNVGLTEAWALLAGRAFASGFRIVTWKARLYKNLMNQADPKFGHMFEDWARQAMIVKGRVYDTAMYLSTDAEWAANQGGINRWLANGHDLSTTDSSSLSSSK